jgi:MYXO-CTERM domain-containing protein
VNLADLTALAVNYGWSAGGGSPAPEPAGPALLVLGGLAMLRRRRQN